MRGTLVISIIALATAALFYRVQSIHNHEAYAKSWQCLFLKMNCPNEDQFEGFIAEDYKEIMTKAIRAHLEGGNSAGFSFAAHVDNKLVVDISAGHVVGKPGEPYTRDLLQPIFSSGKMAMSVLSCYVASKYNRTFRLSDLISKHWPEFAAAGKKDITFSDVLMHDSNLPFVDGFIKSADEFNANITTMLAAQRPLPLNSTERVYHALLRGNILGEVMLRVTNQTVTQLMDELLSVLDKDFAVLYGWRTTHPEMASRVAESEYAHGSLITLIRFALDGNLLQDKFSQAEERLVAGFLGLNDNPYHLKKTTAFVMRSKDPALEPEVYRMVAPSFAGVSNARSLAALASLVASEGKFGDKQVIDPEILKFAWELTPARHDHSLEQATVFTRGGFGKQSLLSIVARESPMMGWKGAGGSICLSNREGIAFAYVPNTLQRSLLSERSKPLYEAVISVAEQKKRK